MPCPDFVQSKDLERILVIAKARRTTISNVLNISDEYLAFCLDETAEYIIGRLKDGEKPTYKTEKPTSFSDFYHRIGADN